MHVRVRSMLWLYLMPIMVITLTGCNLATALPDSTPVAIGASDMRVPSPTFDPYGLPTLIFPTGAPTLDIPLTTPTALPTLIFNTLSAPTQPVQAMPTGVAIAPAATRRTAPARPDVTTPVIPLLPDSAFVNSPQAVGFDIEGFIAAQPGLIRSWSENVSGRTFTAADTIQFISINMSVNPRLLLALAEYQGGWLSNPEPLGGLRDYPFGKAEEARKGFFLQAIWAGNILNQEYYDWRQRGVTQVTLPDGSKLPYAPELPAGTVALQGYFAGLSPDRATWERHIGADGFIATYRRLFGDPFVGALDPLLPYPLIQPPLTLPFPRGETWYFTSGPHGAWGRLTSGWGAVDFAPPTPPEALIRAEGKCYISPYFVTAVAPGIIARSGDGAVVLDLDMDGDERTGWTITYLHIAKEDRIARGTPVVAGTVIGRPSCQGFYLNSPGTHVHISRRYNGEWIAADCALCRWDVDNPRFVMGGWMTRGEPRRANDGWLESDGAIRRLNATRDEAINGIIW